MTSTYLIRRIGVAAAASGLDAALTRLRRLEEQPHAAPGVRWMHSYALREADGGFGLMCVFESDGIEALRRHATLAALPAPGIEAVRFARAWRAFAPTKVYLVRRRGVGVDALQLERRLATARRIADDDMPLQVSWLHTYALQQDDGGLGTACLFQALDPGALREHAARAGLPAGEITPVLGRIVFREPFPHPARAAGPFHPQATLPGSQP